MNKIIITTDFNNSYLEIYKLPNWYPVYHDLITFELDENRIYYIVTVFYDKINLFGQNTSLFHFLALFENYFSVEQFVRDFWKHYDENYKKWIFRKPLISYTKERKIEFRKCPWMGMRKKLVKLEVLPGKYINHVFI